MRLITTLALMAALSGCVYAPQAPQRFPAPQPVAPPPPQAALAANEAARNFITVVSRVEPVAEAMCLERTRGLNCDFQIVIDDRPNQPPNAFQTVDRSGRPLLGFTVALIADARNADEIAFVLGHEAAHHIAGHIPAQKQEAMSGALLGAILASATGAGPEAVKAAQEMGATVGARRFAKSFELEADALGTELAFHAGYDPVRGAAFFERLPDPGDNFLGTHPPNAQRQQTVRAVMAGLR